MGLRSLGRIIARERGFSGRFAEAAADRAGQAELARARDDAAFTRLIRAARFAALSPHGGPALMTLPPSTQKARPPNEHCLGQRDLGMKLPETEHPLLL